LLDGSRAGHRECAGDNSSPGETCLPLSCLSPIAGARQRDENAPEEHAVRTLHFKTTGNREWRLDRIGPKRWSRKMP
jgi:hypothetical protein